MLLEDSANTLYIVGYPKSGNTWVTRLIADALRAYVLDEVMGPGHDVACEINDRLQFDCKQKLKVAKIHYPPNMFFDRVCANPKYIVYVYRDFRDVANSAFFYWNRKHSKSNMNGNMLSKLRYRVLQRPLLLYRYRVFVNGLAENTNEWFSKYVGHWSEHTQMWQEYLISDERVRHASVSYESLWKDPVGVLGSLFDTLGFAGRYSTNCLKEAVDRESFEGIRSYYGKRCETEQGKENITFLRKGSPQDWQNYFTRALGLRVATEVGTRLVELGYEPDCSWPYKLPRVRL